MEVSGQLDVPASVPLRKESVVPACHERLGGPQSWSGHIGKETISLLLLGIKPWSSIPQASHYTD